MAGRDWSDWEHGANDWAMGAEDAKASDSDEERALVEALDDLDLDDLDDIEAAETQMLIVPGSGVSMGNPFIKRRQRSLTLRLAILGLMACVLLTGVFAVTPLGSNAAGSLTSFQALSGSVIWGKGPEYFWYTTTWNDTPESLAKQFNVQVGGIYELNGLYEGDELQVGTAYKIPTDPKFGKNYKPPTLFSAAGANWSGKRFGPNWWNSMAGTPPAESPCAPNGAGKPLNYDLKSPNWGSHWVRGFIVYGTWVYHTGVDVAAPEGNPIHAAQAGQVIWSGYDGTNGLGWSVKIDNCNHISTVYGHMEKSLVKTGQYVQAGEAIGLEGSTGNSTGPHLHFMVEYDNIWVDPMRYYASQYNITHYVGG
jgi:murein DD-endopeptidase MepM/ murein hydrolase activator NlpD